MTVSHPSAVFQSINQRTEAAWQELLSRCDWDYFVTLTVDPRRFPVVRGKRRVPRMQGESWLKAWRWFLFQWIRACAIRSGRARQEGDRLRGPWINAWRHGRGRPMWVLALEPHRDGRLHAHALVKMTRDLPWLDYKVGVDLWWKDRGIAWFERPRSQSDVQRYVTKYVTKHEGGSGSLYLSQNCDFARMTPCTSMQAARSRTDGCASSEREIPPLPGRRVGSPGIEHRSPRGSAAVV